MDTLGSLLDNLTQALFTLDASLPWLAAVLGLACVGHGLILCIRHTKTHTHLGAGLAHLCIGFLLFSIHAFVEALSLSFFEEEVSLSKELSHIAGTSVIRPYLRFSVAVVVLVGTISILKGLWYLRRASMENDTPLVLGIGHIAAGVVCVNIITFAEILGKTCGGAVQQILTLLFL